jgi:hypothetical protein
MASLASIRHLLPNEHLLNFYAGTPTLPDWLGSSLNLILGAGDLDQGGIPNVQKFSMFDVFFCEPWDERGSLRQNIDYLLKNYNKQKVICFLDIKNRAQLDVFCSLFRGRFSLVDGYGGHTPHLPIECIEQILEPGGKAVNLYEMSEAVIGEEEFTHLIKEMPTAEEVRHLFRKLSLFDYNTQETKDSIMFGYKYHLIKHIQKKLSTNKSIHIDWSILRDVDRETEIGILKIILAVFLMYDPLPLTLKGTFGFNKRIWQPEEFTLRELVVTKVVSGGRRKRKNKRKSKTRKITKKGGK